MLDCKGENSPARVSSTSQLLAVGHMEQPGAIPTTFLARPGGWRMLPGTCCQGSSALWVYEEKVSYLKGFGGFSSWAGVQVLSSQGKAKGGGKWKAQQWH